MEFSVVPTGTEVGRGRLHVLLRGHGPTAGLDGCDMIGPGNGGRLDADGLGDRLTIPRQSSYGHSRTVLLCDDRPELRDAISTVLAGMPRFRVIGEAVDAPSCLRAVEDSRPDILILDVSLPGGGPAVARAVRNLHPSVHILVYSGRTDPRVQRDMLAAGADQYLVKTGRIGPLIAALDRAAGR